MSALRTLLLAIAIMGTFTTGAAEETEDPAVTRFMGLVKARSPKCSFPSGVFTENEKGSYQTKPQGTVAGERSLDMHFDSIDAKAGSARLIGNQGAANINVVFKLAGLMFIERTGSGGLNFTTVFGDSTAAEGAFLAVHSRHLSLPMEMGGPTLSQWYGTCKIWE